MVKFDDVHVREIDIDRIHVALDLGDDIVLPVMVAGAFRYVINGPYSHRFLLLSGFGGTVWDVIGNISESLTDVFFLPFARFADICTHITEVFQPVLWQFLAEVALDDEMDTVVSQAFLHKKADVV